MIPTSPMAPRGLPLTPEQLGRGLACVPRWNGGTIAPWSVLQHTIVCMGVAQVESDDPVLIAYAALHDAEEIFTGDIPRPFKTEEQIVLGRSIRMKILDSYGVPAPPLDLWAKVKDIDDRVLVVEQAMLTHPRFHPREFAIDLDIADMVWDATQVTPWAAADLYGQALRECFDSKEMRALMKGPA